MARVDRVCFGSDRSLLRAHRERRFFRASRRHIGGGGDARQWHDGLRTRDPRGDLRGRRARAARAARPRRRLGRGDSRVPQAAHGGCRFPGGARGPASGSPGPRAPPPAAHHRLRRESRAASAGASARETAREAPEPMRVPASPRRTPRAEAEEGTVCRRPAPAPRGARAAAPSRGARTAPPPSPRPPSRPHALRGVFRHAATRARRWVRWGRAEDWRGTLDRPGRHRARPGRPADARGVVAAPSAERRGESIRSRARIERSP